jgi:hypothetical protein
LCSNSTIVREILPCASRMALPLDIAHLSKYRWQADGIRVAQAP